ncbi:MAG TPA: DUF3310 domain-containing protein [Sphingomonas sp.]|jgi:hypothetical protein
MSDVVNQPPHYTAGKVECIDAIEAALGRDGFIAYLRGQIIKYQWRLGLKDAAAQDAAKAHWYSTKLQSQLEQKA